MNKFLFKLKFLFLILSQMLLGAAGVQPMAVQSVELRRARPRSWWALLALCVGSLLFMFVVDSTHLVLTVKETGSMDLSSLVAQFLALAGVGALIALLVNAGKAAGWVKDTTAPTWTVGLNLLGLVALFFLRVFKPDLDVGSLDGIAATVAQIGVLVLGLITQVGASKVAHIAVRGAAVIGYSHTLRAALILLCLLGLGLAFGSTAQAAGPEDTFNYLSGEQYLRCVAAEAYMPLDMTVQAKMSFDRRFGFAHQIVTPDQWRATYGERIQFFTDWLGVPNPTIDGTPRGWCSRLIQAQELIGATP